MTSVLETALYVADLDRSCDFYERPQRRRRARSSFDLRKSLVGKYYFFSQRDLPRPQRFIPEVLSRHTTAMDGFIWRSPSPPAISPLGENACNRTAWRGEMEWPRGGTSLYFRDPDDHLVELATPGLWSIY